MNVQLVHSIALVLASLTCYTCESSSCPPPNYAPGDMFKITFNGLKPGYSQCDVMPLDVGLDFTLTVGFAIGNDPYGSCFWYSATPEVPKFAQGFMLSCSLSDRLLGLECRGKSGTGCEIEMSTTLSGPLPSHPQIVVEHNTLTIEMTGLIDDYRCVPTDCSEIQYDVSVEKLPVGADAGG